MRIQDFLRPYLDGVTRVVEFHAGALSIEQYLQLPEGVSYERRTPDEVDWALPLDQPGVLPVTLLGPDRARHGREEDALRLLRGLVAGQRCAVLLGYQPDALPLHLVLDELSTGQGQLLQVASLEHQHLHCGAMVVAAGGRVVVPRDPFGEPFGGDDQASDLTRQLRLANEYVLLDFVSRNLRSRLFRARATRRAGTTDEERHRSDVERSAELARAELERAQAELQQALDDARRARSQTDLARADANAAYAEAERFRDEAERIRRSISFQLGRLLVETARHPQRSARLPGDLVRLWRNRGSEIAQAGSGDGTAPSRPQISAPLADGERRRFLAHSAFVVGLRTRPTIAGILTEPTRAAFRFDAVVNDVGPNDARMLVERTEPDILLVESAALEAGQPWAYASDAAGADRMVELVELVNRVHALGRAAVLIRDRRSSASAGLIPIESRFDVVLDAEPAGPGDDCWSRGVQLGLFHPIGAPDERDPRPLMLGSIDPRDPLPSRRFAERALAALGADEVDGRPIAELVAPDGAASGPPASRGEAVRWRETPELYRQRLVALARPFTAPRRIRSIEPTVLEQLACGVRVVSGPNHALAAAFGGNITFADEPLATPRALAAVRDAGPPTAAELWRLLRALFERYASPVMLSRLTRQLPGVANPLAGRSVAVVIKLGRTSEHEAIVDSLIRQAHRPSEAIVIRRDGGSWPDGAQESLESAGIEVHSIEAHDSATWRDVAEAVASPWLTRWPEGRPVGTYHLLDLVIGGEMSRGEGVAYHGGDELRHVSGIALDGGIVRREVLSAAGAPLLLCDDEAMVDSTRRGWRLLSIGAARTR